MEIFWSIVVTAFVVGTLFVVGYGLFLMFGGGQHHQHHPQH